MAQRTMAFSPSSSKAAPSPAASFSCAMVNGDPSSVHIFAYFSADATPRFGRMNRWRTNHHPMRFMGAMRLSMRNLARYFRTARGRGTAGVPVFTRSTPVRSPSATLSITFPLYSIGPLARSDLQANHQENVAQTAP